MFVGIESIRGQVPFDPFKAIVDPTPIGFRSFCWKNTVSICDATGEFSSDLVTQTLFILL